MQQTQEKIEKAKSAKLLPALMDGISNEEEEATSGT